MWTNENRARHDGGTPRYPSDLTDAEWELVAPLIFSAKWGGNKRTADVREIVNGIMYILGTGCQWSALPKDLPPRGTVNDYFRRWERDGTLVGIHHALCVQCRERAGRAAGPFAAISHRQSGTGAKKGGARSIRGAVARARSAPSGSTKV
ncbi:MAG: transposase [Acetobacteraceae bacterium]|nr:transposase [Acetobacteraceae bacterium]